MNYDTWKLSEPPTTDVDAIERTSGYLTIECDCCEAFDEVNGNNLEDAREDVKSRGLCHTCPECGGDWREKTWTADGHEALEL